MNTQLLRGLIAGLNILLIFGTLAFGYKTFFMRSPVPAGEQVPNNFDAVDYQIKEAAVAKRKISDFNAVWLHLRTPKPVAPVQPTTPIKRAPIKRQPENLGRRFDLVMVSISREDPERSTCMVETKGGGKHYVLKIGEKIPSSSFVLRELAAEGKDVRATVEAPGGKREQILLRK